jgi:hypothetical protein
VDTDEITLTFPARPEYLRLARIATADAASRAGLDYEEIDDMRIAVSELCGLLADGRSPTITLALNATPGSLTVAGEAATIVPALQDGDLSLAIVAAVVDDHAIETADGVTRFRVTKRSRVASI